MTYALHVKRSRRAWAAARRRLCPGCGRAGARAGRCRCGYECEIPPPRLCDCLSGEVPPGWADHAALVRGVVRALDDVLAPHGHRSPSSEVAFQASLSAEWLRASL